MDKRIDVSVLRLFGHIERKGNDRIAERVYTGECLGSHLVGQPRKMWSDRVNDHSKKGGLEIRQARRMVHERNGWWRFERKIFGGEPKVDEPLNLTRGRSCGVSRLYKAFKGGGCSPHVWL